MIHVLFQWIGWLKINLCTGQVILIKDGFILEIEKQGLVSMNKMVQYKLVYGKTLSNRRIR